jgi:DNA-binding CsgD family transcriptional regulator
MQQLVSIGEMHVKPCISMVSAEYQTYAYYLTQLIDCFQGFYGSGTYSEAHLASQIATATQDHLQLHFRRQSALSSVVIPYIAGRRGFLVRWSDEIYGSLQVKCTGVSADLPSLPNALYERLAQDCAWGLHVLEKEIAVPQKPQEDRSEALQKVAALSDAQRNVLELMVKGSSARNIAEMLHLSKRTVETHQHNIYQLLDVHSQLEAVLIGLAAGMATR